MSRQKFTELCCDNVFYVATEFDHGQGISCRDRVFLCHDRVFYVATKCGQMDGFCVVIGNFMLRPSWPG